MSLPWEAWKDYANLDVMTLLCLDSSPVSLERVSLELVASMAGFRPSLPCCVTDLWASFQRSLFKTLVIELEYRGIVYNLAAQGTAKNNYGIKKGQVCLQSPG